MKCVELERVGPTWQRQIFARRMMLHTHSCESWSRKWTIILSTVFFSLYFCVEPMCRVPHPPICEPLYHFRSKPLLPLCLFFYFNFQSVRGFGIERGCAEHFPLQSYVLVVIKKLLHHSNSWMTTHMCSDVTMFQDSSFNEFIYFFLIDAHVFRSFGSINSSINLTSQMSDGHWTHKCSSRRRL